MLGSKGILTPLIPDCYVLCTLAILKNILNQVNLKLLELTNKRGKGPPGTNKSGIDNKALPCQFPLSQHVKF